MKLSEQTTRVQHNLGTYCRTGKMQDLPGVSTSRVRHYRRLVFNVVKNTMEQAYPLTLQVLGENAFHELVDDFFKNHDARSPQVWKLPGEFYEYALEAGFQTKTGKKWLNDLLLFEWIEIEVHTMPDIEVPDHTKSGDFINDLLLVNPESRLIMLNYPIHIKNVKEAEQNKGNYFVLVSRNRDSGHVHFFNLSLFHAWIYENIATQKVSIRALLPEIGRNFGFTDEKNLQKAIIPFLSDLQNKQAILGFIR